jgi:hypothetical protein
MSAISLIYESWLRTSFIEEMKKTVEAVIIQQMPSRYTNIRHSGIVDSYESLNIEKLKERLNSAHNTEIRIHKIWMPGIEYLKDTLTDAIEKRGCEVKILLLNPDSKEAIEKRAAATKYLGHDSFVSIIRLNIELLESMRRQLSQNKRDKLQLRLHSSFIAVSMIGYGETILVGFYLRNRIATAGTQLKVCDASRYFHIELSNHFNTEWDLAIAYNWEHHLTDRQIAI